jgi:hypothetical protein
MSFIPRLQAYLDHAVTKQETKITNWEWFNTEKLHNSLRFLEDQDEFAHHLI